MTKFNVEKYKFKKNNPIFSCVLIVLEGNGKIGFSKKKKVLNYLYTVVAEVPIYTDVVKNS